MDAKQLQEAAAAVIGRLIELAREDGPLRDNLRRMADSFLNGSGASARSTDNGISAGNGEATETPAAKPFVPAARTLNPIAPRPAPLAPPPARPPADFLPTGEVLSRLTLGKTAPEAEPAPVAPAASYATSSPSPMFRRPTPGETDLALVETRCRMKAEGARWAAKRRRLLADGASYAADIEPRDREIIAKAKAIPDCFLWMCHPSGPQPAELDLLDDVASCFEAAAEAVGLLRRVLERRESLQAEFEQCLDLLAEAQSALRVSIDWIEGPKNDNEQLLIFTWLKAAAAENQYYIRRHMKVDDPAEPKKSDDLRARIAAIGERLGEAEERVRQRKKLLGKVQHKARMVASGAADVEAEWPLMMSSIDELVTGGLPPSNRDLRDALLPIVENLPDIDTPKSVEMVLREVDRYLASGQASEAARASQAAVQPSAEVREAAQLLEGRSVVLIGGDRRSDAAEALERAFNLSELVWIATRDHESTSGFEPYVARPDVALVLLAIRWSSHSYGEVKDFCDHYGKPLVRLPGGYNPNQVAAQIMQQCSSRLAVK
jgi:hypothetical protein